MEPTDARPISAAPTREEVLHPHPRRSRPKLNAVLRHATIIFFCLIVLVPIAWMVLVSVKSIPDAYTGDLWPKNF
ncbi:unnamed protein product, partial [marine sediment metagenome]